MNIEVLTVPDCPHRAEAVARLRLAVAVARTEDAVLSERVIVSDAQAASAGMNGSPTILIDGVDRFAAEPAEPSVSCRLYPSEAGIEGAPTVDALVDALTNPTGVHEHDQGRHLRRHDSRSQGAGDRT